jgi:hypothetical protein
MGLMVKIPDPRTQEMLETFYFGIMGLYNSSLSLMVMLQLTMGFVVESVRMRCRSKGVRRMKRRIVVYAYLA